MTTKTRAVIVVVGITLAALGCGSAGADAAEQQDLSGLGQFLKTLVAKQAFTGTVVVSDVASGTSSSKDVIGTSTSSTSLNRNVVFTVTQGSVVAKISYEEKTQVDSRLAYQTHTVAGSKTTVMTASGTNNDVATVGVSVDLRSDDTYQISFRTGGVPGVYKMNDTATTTCNPGIEGSTCRPGTSSSDDSGNPPGQGGTSGSVDGRIDKKQPNALVGTMSEPLSLNDGSSGKRTVTWNLSR